MPKFRKKPVIVEATQWFKNGDHPLDNQWMVYPDSDNPFLSEGKVVRYFRHPEVPGEQLCECCGEQMNDHGWIDEPESEQVVCPGDWVVTTENQEHFVCSSEYFQKTYDPA